MNIFERLDQTIPLTEEETLLLRVVRQLAENTIKPRAAKLDDTAEFPWDNVRNINALGLNSMFIPEAYGGTGLSYTAYLACCREIAQACAATGIVWATNFHAVSPLVDFASEEQKQRWLPGIANGGLAAIALTEPDAGSDASAMTTRFTPDGNDIVINGLKTFITNGDVCDILVLFGKWTEIGTDKNAISIVVVEKGTPGFRVNRIEDKMGTRASSTAELLFDNCRVPRENLLGAPGAGMPMLFGFLNKSRPSVAAHALGIARAAFEDAVGYVNERRQFKRRIIEFQGVQFALADLAAELLMCEGLLWHVARQIEAGATDLATEASILKMRASDLAMRMSTEAVQFHGGYGYMRSLRVERLMRDAKITQIWEGTNQIHRQLIGRSLIVR